jgi:CHRD domain
MTLTAAEIADMKARKLYVNMHTAKNPNGEIRGQITQAL